MSLPAPSNCIPFLILFLFSAFSLYLNPKEGVTFSLLIVSFVILFVLNKFWSSLRDFLKPISIPINNFGQKQIQSISISSWIQLCLLGLFVSWIFYEIIDSPVRLRAVCGYFLLLFIALCASTNPRGIRLRPVIGGLALQLIVGTLFLKWEPGARRVRWMVDKAVAFMDLTFHGSEFVYGMAAKSPIYCGSRLSIFFSVNYPKRIYPLGLPNNRIFWSFCFPFVPLGNHPIGPSKNSFDCSNHNGFKFLFEINQCFRHHCCRVFECSRLYLLRPTGYACIAGSLFSAFISFGVRFYFALSSFFQACPSYLLIATIMSSLASIAISKIVYPEEKTHDSNEEIQFSESEAESALESISMGAVKSAYLVVLIGSILVITFAFLSSINDLFGYFGQLLGYDFISVNWLMAQLFYPLAYLMGSSDASDSEIAYKETAYVAELMGIKTAVNEFMAFSRLSELIKSGQLLGARARMIGTFASTGFSNISMLGNMLAIMTSLAPSKKEEIIQVIVRALLCGCISCFLSATVAGIIVADPVICDPISSSSHCVDIQKAISFIKNQTITI